MWVCCMRRFFCAEWLFEKFHTSPCARRGDRARSSGRRTDRRPIGAWREKPRDARAPIAACGFESLSCDERAARRATQPSTFVYIRSGPPFCCVCCLSSLPSCVAGIIFENSMPAWGDIGKNRTGTLNVSTTVRVAAIVGRFSFRNCAKSGGFFFAASRSCASWTLPSASRVCLIVHVCACSIEARDRVVLRYPSLHLQ